MSEEYNFDTKYYIKSKTESGKIKESEDKKSNLSHKSTLDNFEIKCDKYPQSKVSKRVLKQYTFEE